MSKIFKRTSLQSKSKSRKPKVEKNRKRNVIVNFRMSEEEKALLNEKIALSGLQKQNYMIEISLNHKVNVYGNVRVFDELENKLFEIEKHIKSKDFVYDISENKLLLLEHILIMFCNYRENKKDSTYGNR